MAKKYRPYLTIEEMTEILSGTLSENLRFYLESFRRKCDSGTISPQHVATPRVSSMETKLGFSGGKTLSESKEDAYKKLQNSGLGTLSVQEVARAQMYRYENDLMTREEEEEYEKRF